MIYFCDGMGSVFDSQVLELLNEICRRDIFESTYLFLGIRNESQIKELHNKNINTRIIVVFYRSFPNYPFFNFLIRKSLKRALGRKNLSEGKCIYHTRGELLSWHLSKVLEKKYWRKIIPDIRGAVVAEIEEFYNFSQLQKILKLWNYKRAIKCLNKFNNISVVSDSLKNLLVNKYNIQSTNINVIPSLAGHHFRFDINKRDIKRKELGLNYDDILIVFSSGGTAIWQNNNSIKYFAEKGFKILNLSKKIIEHKNIVNKFVQFSEVPAYLNASDIAVIWRKKSIVNEVASPVKFSEYVCTGLPVLSNENVKSIRDYVIKNKSGEIVDELESIDSNLIQNLATYNQSTISDVGRTTFGINSIADQYLKLYAEIE